MRDEIAAAVVFITRFVKKNDNLTKQQIETFSNRLSSILVEKFKNHWYNEDPNKGQAYRCIRVNETEPIDPVLEQAAIDCELKYEDLKMPPEFTLWVDPHEVCCRFGELKGSHCTIASFKCEKADIQAHTINIEDVVEKAEKQKSSEMTRIHRPAKSQSKYHTNNFAKARNNLQNVHNKFSLPSSRIPYFPGLQHPLHNKLHYYQQAFQQVGCDRYHWVRGADLVMV